MSLQNFSMLREEILSTTIDETVREFISSDPEQILTESLFSERQRLNREGFHWLTASRIYKDRKLWSGVRRSLLADQSPFQDHKLELRKVITHYSNEICGRFNPKIYELATKAIPFGFNFLLNAASVKTILPWKFKEAVSDRIEIQGDLEHLRRLSQKGTVLFVPTHQSHVDSVLIGYLVYLLGLPPVAYGAGLNLFSNPFLGFFMSNLGAYTVDRKKTSDVYKRTLKNYSTTLLRHGVHSLFFPGGGRTRSGAIESKLKLGLLGTALDAEAKNYLENKSNPQVFVVPMVTSYHFVLEAGSLIEDYLAEAGRHRFIITDDEASQISKVLRFFWHLFKGNSRMTVRVGQALDVFGNIVDENGMAVGPNSTTIDPKKWLSTNGVLGPNPSRDREYVRRLGEKIVHRFYNEHPVLTSSLVAYSYFEALKRKHSDFELYRLLRLAPSQRSLDKKYVMQVFEEIVRKVNRGIDSGLLFRSISWVGMSLERIFQDGMQQLGMFHGVAVLKEEQERITSDDLSLLYYYRNRLSGYQLGLPKDHIQILPGVVDAQGFLA